MLVGFQFCCSLCHVFLLPDLLNWCCFLIHSTPLFFFSSELPCSWILDLPKVSILSNHRTKRSERFEEFGQKCSRHRLMTTTCHSSRYLCYSINIFRDRWNTWHEPETEETLCLSFVLIYIMLHISFWLIQPICVTSVVLTRVSLTTNPESNRSSKRNRLT